MHEGACPRTCPLVEPTTCSLLESTAYLISYKDEIDKLLQAEQEKAAMVNKMAEQLEESLAAKTKRLKIDKRRYAELYKLVEREETMRFYSGCFAGISILVLVLCCCYKYKLHRRAWKKIRSLTSWLRRLW